MTSQQQQAFEPLGAHNSTLGWQVAIRPKTLLTGWGPITLGIALGMSTLPVITTTHWLVAVACLVVVTLLQAAANIVNDLKDFQSKVDNNTRVGPPRAAQSGLLSSRELWTGFLVLVTSSLVIGIAVAVVAGLEILLLGLACIAAAYAYSGSKYPLSHLGLGEVTALVFFGPVAVLGTSFALTSTWQLEFILPALAPGFFAAAMMAVNNLRDIDQDRAAGKRTLLVWVGPRYGQLVPIFLMINGYVCGAVYLVKVDSVAAGIALLLACFVAFRMFILPYFNLHPRSLNEGLKRISIFNLIYCLVCAALIATVTS